MLICLCRPLAKDGVNRSFAAVYDGEHSPDAAKDAADRLHLILQREDALVAKSSGENFTAVTPLCHELSMCADVVLKVQQQYHVASGV